MVQVESVGVNYPDVSNLLGQSLVNVVHKGFISSPLFWLSRCLETHRQETQWPAGMLLLQLINRQRLWHWIWLWHACKRASCWHSCCCGCCGRFSPCFRFTPPVDDNSWSFSLKQRRPIFLPCCSSRGKEGQETSPLTCYISIRGSGKRGSNGYSALFQHCSVRDVALPLACERLGHNCDFVIEIIALLLRCLLSCPVARP